MGELRVGTSGWAYRSWVGPFYPEGTKDRDLLAAYAARFPVVEAHHTFRRWPTASVVEKWAASVPDGFRFAPKVNMRITQGKQPLEEITAQVTEFAQSLSPLGPRLGPLFFQLPRWVRCDIDRLDALLQGLPPGTPAAFELPHESWADAAVDERLADRGATRVLVDRDGMPPASLAEGLPFAYVRLRREEYDDDELSAWAKSLRAAAEDGRDVYAFVKHDEGAIGPAYAARVAEGAGP